MSKTENPLKDPFDGEYIGNIWGWKISFIGLGVMLVMGLLMAYRHHQINNWDMGTPELEEQVMPSTKPDSTYIHRQ